MEEAICMFAKYCDDHVVIRNLGTPKGGVTSLLFVDKEFDVTTVFCNVNDSAFQILHEFFHVCGVNGGSYLRIKTTSVVIMKHDGLLILVE